MYLALWRLRYYLTNAETTTTWSLTLHFNGGFEAERFETKGAGWNKMENVEPKVQAAEEWCARVSELTRQRWQYAKVVDVDFAWYRGMPLLQLLDAVKSS